MSSVGELLAAAAGSNPGAIAVRSKRHGLWKAVTYGELRDRVASVAGGLAGLGVGPGDPVALVAENSPEWIVADLAVQWLGATSVALPPQTPTDALVRVLAESGAAVVICGDQEHVDTVLEHPEQLGSVRSIVVINRTGLNAYDDPRLRSFADLSGTEAVKPGAGSAVFFSLGTGGDPRPVSHASGVVAQVAGDVASWLELTASDRGLCMLSLALPTARVVDLYALLAAGAQISVPESPATALADLEEVEPTVLCASPRALELLRASSERRSRASSRLRRRAYAWAQRKLHSRLDSSDGARTRAGASRGRGPAWLLVGRFVAGKLGVARLRRIAVTGGPVAARDARFFWALGIPVLESYGQAELAGPVLAQDSLDDAGTVGRALPGVRSRVSADGELEISSPATGDGWHATGDLAEEAGDERVRVRGRREDLVRAGGEEVIVAGLEAALCDSAYIRRSVVAPLDGTRLTAIVEVDPDEAGRWAAERDIHFSTYGSLVSRPEIAELVGQEVSAANERIGARTAIADFIVLQQALSVAAGELTAGLTVRRRVIIERVGEAPRTAQASAG
jgi:long-chain acyl-CoA synthetase